MVTINILMDMNRILYRMSEDANYQNVLKRMREYHFCIDLVCCKYDTFLASFQEQEVVCFLKIIREISHKKIFMLLANCQGEVIYPMLKDIKEFTENYYIIETLPFYMMKIKGIKNISEATLKQLDLFVYQYVEVNSEYYKAFASDHILELLENKCIAICIPNLYFRGYFPQVGGYRYINEESIILNNGVNNLFAHVDTWIEKEYSKSHSVKKVIAALKDINYISKEEILWNLQCTLDELKKRETKCDIIMSDYIEKNYTKKMLFTEPEHPVNEVIAELVNRLLAILKIKERVLYFDKYGDLSCQNALVYPCVSHMLGLFFKCTKYCCCRAIFDRKISLEEYIELYIRNVC